VAPQAPGPFPLDTGPKNETAPKIEAAQLEKEILSLLNVLRALIEGAPSKGSAAQL
jgi:hypothetical protein